MKRLSAFAVTLALLLSLASVSARADVWYDFGGEVGNNLKYDMYGHVPDGVTLPSTLTCLGEYAFNKCASIVSTALLGPITSVEPHTFDDCENLSRVALSQNVTTIPERMFSNVKPTRVFIPLSVTSIGYRAFSGCGGIQDIYYPGTQAQYFAIAIDSSENDWVNPAKLTDPPVYHYNFSQDHNPVAHPATVPTCTEAGWYAYDTCSRCDYTIYEERPAKGHQYKDGVCSIYCTDDAVTIEPPAFSGDKVTVTLHCDEGVKAQAVCAMYNADGELVSVELVELTPGQDNVLTFTGYDPALTVKLLAIDAGSSVPLCAAMKA